MEFASRGSPSPKRIGFASHPYTANGIRFKGVPFSTAYRTRIKRATLSKANGIHNKRVTLSKRMGLASRGSPSPKRMRFASDAGPSCSRDPFQGILLQGHATQGIPFLQRASPLCLSEWYSLQEILILPNNNVLSRGAQILLDDAFIPSFVS